MLPFLKPQRKQDGIATQVRASDYDKKAEGGDVGDEGLEAAMKDFCDAEERKDYKAMAAAFKAAFEMLELQPHEEVEHEAE